MKEDGERDTVHAGFVREAPRRPFGRRSTALVVRTLRLWSSDL